MAENENTTETTETKAKVWTDDYVTSLREEAKKHRLEKKATESKLKSLIGLKDDDELTDDKITEYQAKREKSISDKIAQANERLLKAEIKSLNDYDSKLLDRLLDRSKVTIADDGTVTGLKEAIAELEKEFPQVKKNSPPPATNPGVPGSMTLQQQYEAAMSEAYKNPRNQELAKKVFLLKEQLRQQT